MRNAVKLLKATSAELAAESAELLALSAELITRSGVLVQSARTSAYSLHIARSAAQQRYIASNPYLLLRRREQWIADLLRSAMDAADADFGNVQLFDPTSQALRIAAHSGFQDEFLSYFEHVTIEHTSVCGRAFEHKARVVVPSVASDDFFGSDEVRCALLQAQVEAVQSTPLFAPSGAFLGMLSTHYRRPNPLSNGILDRLDRVVENFVASL